MSDPRVAMFRRCVMFMFMIMMLTVCACVCTCMLHVVWCVYVCCHAFKVCVSCASFVYVVVFVSVTFSCRCLLLLMMLSCIGVR